MRFDKIMSFLREIPTRIDAPTVMDVSLLLLTFFPLFRRSDYFCYFYCFSSSLRFVGEFLFEDRKSLSTKKKSVISSPSPSLSIF
jgi:predicted alpha/beta superfamily hydrolase